MKSPEISVCIPVYNTEPFIAEAIESALNQTFKDFELIILDNRSTDNTLKIVRKFKDKRIRVVAHEKNLGAEANWNAA
ncbi:MAG TPA: glycosyltransferase family 2 protein, partial [Leptospiraceae bacterium]|nr:glycosyltransferase family 2 protein [Leptospiraceae bacterium]